MKLTNPGHQYGYKNFTSKQILSLKKLLNYLIKKYKINKEFILGHSDISPDRKKDPGEKFPWQILSKSKLSYWHNLDLKKIKKHRNVKLTSQNEKNSFLKIFIKLDIIRLNLQI